MVLQPNAISPKRGKTVVNTVYTGKGDVAQLARALDWQSNMAKLLTSRIPYIARLSKDSKNRNVLVVGYGGALFLPHIDLYSNSVLLKLVLTQFFIGN